MLQQRSSRLLSYLTHCSSRSVGTALSASLRCRSQRAYSIHADASVGTKINNIDPSKLSITKTTTPKTLLPPGELIFGHTFTGAGSQCWSRAPVADNDPDHMLSLEWTASEGWLPARITPYQNLSLDPATCVFHYAFEAFEGMKAYKDKNGAIRLFRPDRNMARLNKSVARIALPTFDGDAMIDLISTFVKLDERFIPE
jgi:branched-chain amino acid aminotransferase